jgi:hypothetical protein
MRRLAGSRHLIETTRWPGFKSLAVGAKRSTRLRRARRGRRHATSASSPRSELFRRRRSSSTRPRAPGVHLSPTHRPGGACRGTEWRQADGLLRRPPTVKDKRFCLTEAAGRGTSRSSFALPAGGVHSFARPERSVEAAATATRVAICWKRDNGHVGRRLAARLEIDSGDLVRDVRFLEPCDFVVAQRQLLGCERVLKVCDLCRAHDRRGDGGLVQQPG